MVTSSFRAMVSSDMIAKAGWLFNASVEQVLSELLQNARRVGANTVCIVIVFSIGIK